MFRRQLRVMILLRFRQCSHDDLLQLFSHLFNIHERSPPVSGFPQSFSLFEGAAEPIPDRFFLRAVLKLLQLFIECFFFCTEFLVNLDPYRA